MVAEAAQEEAAPEAAQEVLAVEAPAAWAEEAPGVELAA